MQQVKIYTASPSDLSPPVQSESFCVDLVLASDYRELEAKCMELAAESTALKKSEVEFNEYCRRECEDVGDTWVDDFTETPATDVFLAEVRASGVDAAIEHLHKKFDGTGHIGVPVMALEWLAQEIRKGGAA
ncbi:hypothetical protein LD928_01150 [Salmonella enterica]|nr:hypothetical protein [Salmonella enterica]